MIRLYCAGVGGCRHAIFSIRYCFVHILIYTFTIGMSPSAYISIWFWMIKYEMTRAPLSVEISGSVCCWNKLLCMPLGACGTCATVVGTQILPKGCYIANRCSHLVPYLLSLCMECSMLTQCERKRGLYKSRYHQYHHHCRRYRCRQRQVAIETFWSVCYCKISWIFDITNDWLNILFIFH